MNILQPNAKQPIASRIIPVPDAPDQVVSLQDGWWECLDWMITERGVPLREIARDCWQHILTYPEQGFGNTFEYFLHCYMQNYFCESNGLANNNYQEPQAPKPDHNEGMPPIRRILVSSRIKMLLKTYYNLNGIASLIRIPANDRE
jgi:hypothetical protein